MSAHEFTTPQIEYAAKALRQFAHEHDVTTDDETIAFSHDHNPEAIRRQGHVIGDAHKAIFAQGYGRKFEVAKDVPRTIPLLLGRLALYDHGQIAEGEGVEEGKVRWLRLVNVGMEDPRIDEILAIVDATRSQDNQAPLTVDIDTEGGLVYSTRHPFAGDDYALTVSQVPYFGNYTTPLTLIDFSLPSQKPNQ